MVSGLGIVHTNSVHEHKRLAKRAAANGKVRLRSRRALLQIDGRIQTQRIGPIPEEQRRFACIDDFYGSIRGLQRRGRVSARDDDSLLLRLRLCGRVTVLLCKGCACTNCESNQRSSCFHADGLS